MGPLDGIHRFTVRCGGGQNAALIAVSPYIAWITRTSNSDAVVIATKTERRNGGRTIVRLRLKFITCCQDNRIATIRADIKLGLLRNAIYVELVSRADQSAGCASNIRLRQAVMLNDATPNLAN